MKQKHLHIALLLLFLASSLSAQVQRNAKVFTVNSTVDSVDSSAGDGACADASGRCTLRAAIEEVNASGRDQDAVLFALPNPSTIELTLGEILLEGQVVIIGPGADRLTIQRSYNSGIPDFRLFHFVGGYVDVRGVTLRNGKGTTGGAIFAEHSTLALSDVVLTGNQATDGGGIYSAGGSTALTRCLFDSNTATMSGGAMFLNVGTVTPFLDDHQ
jgi:CSLREA domain-containing protein